MPDTDADERQSARLLTALIWAGVGLAPIAVLVALLGGSGNAVRFAVLLIAVSVVLIGAALLIRNDPVLLRVDLADRVAGEVDQLRGELRAEVAAASGTADHRLHALQEELAELRRHVATSSGPVALPAAPAPVSRPAPAPRAAPVPRPAPVSRPAVASAAVASAQVPGPAVASAAVAGSAIASSQVPGPAVASALVAGTSAAVPTGTAARAAGSSRVPVIRSNPAAIAGRGMPGGSSAPSGATAAPDDGLARDAGGEPDNARPPGRRRDTPGDDRRSRGSRRGRRGTDRDADDDSVAAPSAWLAEPDSGWLISPDQVGDRRHRADADPAGYGVDPYPRSAGYDADRGRTGSYGGGPGGVDSYAADRYDGVGPDVDPAVSAYPGRYPADTYRPTPDPSAGGRRRRASADEIDDLDGRW